MGWRSTGANTTLKYLLLSLITLIGCANPFYIEPTPEAVNSATNPAIPAPLTTNTSGLKTETITFTGLILPKKHLKKLTLDDTRLIHVGDEINETEAKSFINNLVRLEAEDKKKPIHIVIKSYGGSITEGFRMIAAMDATEPELICVVDRGAYSMGAAIFLHCDKKYIQAHADLMFHEGSFQIGGDKRPTQQRFHHVIKQMDELNADIAHQLNMPVDLYLEKAQFEWWLTADEAVAEGIADQAVDGLKYKQQDPPANTWTFFLQ